MNLTCPKCLTDSCVRIDLCDADTLFCPQCEEEYSLDAVAAMVGQWAAVLPWIMSHPARVAAAVPA